MQETPEGSREDTYAALEVRRGNSLAFQPVVERHSNLVYAYLLAKVRDEQVAQELTQRTFISAWRKLASGRPVRNMRGFLIYTAKGELKTHLSDVAEEREHVLQNDEEDGDTLAEIEDSEAVLAFLEVEYDPRDESNEESRLVDQALGALVERDQKILTATYIEKLPWQETMRLLGLDNPTVAYQCLCRARKRFAEAYAKAKQQAASSWRFAGVVARVRAWIDDKRANLARQRKQATGNSSQQAADKLEPLVGHDGIAYVADDHMEPDGPFAPIPLSALPSSPDGSAAILDISMAGYHALDEQDSSDVLELGAQGEDSETLRQEEGGLS